MEASILCPALRLVYLEQSTPVLSKSVPLSMREEKTLIHWEGLILVTVDGKSSTGHLTSKHGLLARAQPWKEAGQTTWSLQFPEQEAFPR